MSRAAPDSDALKQAIRAEAARLGFDEVGFAAPELGAASGRLDAFLAAGWHGDMAWLADKAARRRDPRASGRTSAASSCSPSTTGLKATRWPGWRSPIAGSSRSMPRAATITT